MQTGLKYFLKSSRLILSVMALFTILPAGVALNPPGSWDLKSCIEYATKNNINLNTLRLTASSGAQDLLLAKNARYPNLTGSVSHSTSWTDGTLSNNGSYGIGSSVVLYNGNYYNNDIRSNELALKVANLNVQEAENDITLKITQAYLNILLAGENIAYVKDLVATTASQVSQCEEKYEKGSVARKDLLQLQATLANDKYTLVSSENTKRQNLLALKTLLQLPTDTAFDITIPADTGVTAAVIPLETVQQSALQSMPEMKSGELRVSRQEVELSKVKSAYLPSLNMDAGISSGFNSGSRDSWSDQFSTGITPRVGISLSIPIFNRKATSINMAKSKIALEESKLAYNDTRTTLLQTIEQAYINVMNARSQYMASVEQMNYARESYRISTEQLKIGANNNVEFLQQKNLYVQAVQQYIQAKYSLKLYAKIYNFYQGIPVTE